MFICVPSIIYFAIWTKYGASTGKMSKLVSFLFLSTTIVLCMSYPYEYDGNYLIDFRLIPLVLGTLYFGRLVGATLLVILFAFRFTIGGSGIYIGLLVAAIVFLSLAFIMTKIRLNSRKKLFIALFMSTFLSQVLLKAILLSLNDISFSLACHLILFGLIQFVGICLSVYYVELIRSHFSLLEEMKEIEKMKAISQVAASVAHEIRNPLTAVNGLLQVFKEKELPAGKRELLANTAILELSSAINTISDYLTFAQPRITTMTLLDLSAELRHVVRMLTPYADTELVTLTAASYTDQTVPGDSELLRRSLINLIKNSIEASANGSVDVTVQRIRKAVVIRIQDTGCGMTKQQIHRLGTPYYSLKEKGTGLGTMVAFSIIRAMNGAIHVESEINKGSLVEISFPVQ